MLEKELFTLNMNNVYLQLNSPRTPESTLEALTNDMVVSLMSIALVLETVPLIKYTKGNAAEMVARKLEEKSRNQLLGNKMNRSSIHSQTSNFLTFHWQRF